MAEQYSIALDKTLKAQQTNEKSEQLQTKRLLRSKGKQE
jgi:hypothetical protein